MSERLGTTASGQTDIPRRMRWPISEPTLRSDPAGSPGVSRQPPTNAGADPGPDPVRADAFLSSISGARTRQAARLLFASLRQRCSPHSAKNLLVKGGDGSEPAENRGPPLETSTSYPRPPGVAIVARNGNLVRLLNDGGGLEPRLSAGVSRTGSHDTRTSLARRRRRFFLFTAGLTRTEPRSRASSRLAAFSQSNFAIHPRSVVVPGSPNPSRPRYQPPA
jgi:hypothetical protein